MLRFTFRGGIHPDDGKAMSKDKPIREVLPKGELVYPLSQHIGAPAKAIVVKGHFRADNNGNFGIGHVLHVEVYDDIVVVLL